MAAQGSGSATTRRRFIGSVAAMTVVPTWSTARADDWPTRSVTFVVGFSAGGNIDVVGRLMAGRLSEKLGQTFVVENRIGGMGTVGALGVLQAPPDGYALFWAGTGTISIFPAMGGKPLYDTAKDLVPISILGTSPQVLVINPSLPAKTVQEFVAYVKAQPTPLSYGAGGGPGSASNLIMALFLKRAGLTMTPVSYRGTSMAMNDLIGGHIPAMFVPLPEALPQAESGKIRMLGISSAKRALQAPDLPSIAESGYPGYDIVSWVGLMAPAAIPKPIIAKLAAEFASAVRDPAFVKQLDKYGLEPLGLSPEESVKFLESDRKLWGEAVTLAGVSLN
jgi:tripartite-type tricarboxylate transporter receptor subunit TctC